MAREHLTERLNWSSELVERLDPAIVSTIAVARETGLEGFSIPVTLQVRSPDTLSDVVGSTDPLWRDYIDNLERSTAAFLDPAIRKLRDHGLETRSILRFTTAVSFKSTDDQLIELLTSVMNSEPYAWLNAPGELELDAARLTVHVEEIDLPSDLDGEGQVVAVIDGEVDLNHSGLAGRVTRKGNFSDTDWGAGGLGDSLGRDHGTKVAAIVAGNGIHNGGRQAYRGIAPKAAIWNYKIAPLLADGSSVAAALEQACIDGARIANLSWGQSKTQLDGRSIWAQTVDVAFSKGMLTVKSAGNSGPAPGSITSPADARNVLSVGATDRKGQAVHEKSSRGPAATGMAKPELVAPGGGVQVPTANGATEAVAIPGTSFAAPVVSGIAALGLQKNPTWSAETLRAELISACARIPASSDEVQGAGLIDARRFVGAGT
jgi:subtilisin family serine protease